MNRSDISLKERVIQYTKSTGILPCIKLHKKDDYIAYAQAMYDAMNETGKKLHTGRSRNDQVALDMKLYTRDEIKEKSVEEIDEILKDAFTFDNFARQYETKTEITESKTA